MQVVLATHNSHKVAEFQRIIAAVRPEISLVGFDGPAPVEDGVTFAENALIKARAAARATGDIALADDSGICVDVLGGAPGIFSARWAGAAASDEKNRTLLLEQLSDVPDAHRGAYFECTIALVVPESPTRSASEHVVSGQWRGTIARSAEGPHGFGYDPIFHPTGIASSAATLTAEEKNRVSHRARAFELLNDVLGDVFGPRNA